MAFVLKRISYAEIHRGDTPTHPAPPEWMIRPNFPQEVIHHGTEHFTNSPAWSNAYTVPYERHHGKHRPYGTIDSSHYYRSLAEHLAPAPVNVDQLADIIDATTSTLEKFNVRTIVSL